MLIRPVIKLCQSLVIAFAIIFFLQTVLFYNTRWVKMLIFIQILTGMGLFICSTFSVVMLIHTHLTSYILYNKVFKLKDGFNKRDLDTRCRYKEKSSTIANFMTFKEGIKFWYSVIKHGTAKAHEEISNYSKIEEDLEV